MNIATKRKRIRFKLKRLSNRPRVSVHKTNKYVYIQVVDQQTGHVITSYDTKRLLKDSKDAASKTGLEKVVMIAKKIAEDLKKNKIKDIVFDRSGYKYHGKVKKIADTLREAGLNF